jgi:hypothetical protein
MFRALLAHLQEDLYKRHLVYCMRVMSVGCTRIGMELVSGKRTPVAVWKNIPKISLIMLGKE